MSISIIGLCVQIAGISILFLLFVFLSFHDKRLYLRYWTVSWLLYAISLSALLVSFLMHWRWLYAIYQFLELFSAGMITAAGMNYAREFRLERRHVKLLIPAAAWALSSTWTVADFNGLYMFHSLFMATAFAYNAYVFFTSAWFRLNVGTRLLAGTCGLISLLEYHYVVIFGYAFHYGLASIPYLQFTSFYDLLLQYVLAIGMVVMGMQETQHRLRAANERLEEAQGKLRYLAQIDPLTGVYNRHAFREICDRELASNPAGKTPHTIVLLDIDNLKQINDLAGHAMGDEALQCVAKTVSSMVRGNDCLVRWGGDEFLLFMQETDPATVRDRMSQLKALLSRQSVKSPAGTIFFGISYGCAEVKSLEGLAAAIEEADRQMYKEKQLSRKSLVLL